MDASILANSKYYNVFLIHENGTEEFIDNNLSKFCKNHNLSRSNIHSLIKGRYKFVKGWRLKTTIPEIIKVKDLLGKIYIVGNNKSKFCRLHNINNITHFCAMIKRKLKSCEGWVLSV